LFDYYKKKLEELEQDVPKIFEKVAKKGAIEFVNKAKDRTDKEGLVDTGYYQRNWQAQAIEPMSDTYGIKVANTAEYASFLEYGHKLRNGKRWKGRFVGDMSLGDAEYYCIVQLDKELEKAFKRQ